MRVNVTIVDDRQDADYAAARKAMLDSQLRTSGINAEFVLSRMGAVTREDFVPASARGVAYADRTIPLGEGRFLAAPEVHGMMLQEAEPTPRDIAIVVDGGSGYLAELLRPLVASLRVISPEDALNDAGADGSATLLLIDGAAEQVPAALVRQLAPEGRAVGGILRNGITRLAVGRRSGDDLAWLPLADMGIPVLPAFLAPKGWSF